MGSASPPRIEWRSLRIDAKRKQRSMKAPEQFRSDAPLSGFRVLVAEDEVLIALTAQEMLSEAGAAEIVVATRADEALKYLNEPLAFHAAVIDLNLGAGIDLSLAAAARRNRVPFVFATGYGGLEMLPVHLADVPIVTKPYTADALVTAVREIADRPGARLELERAP
jgi:DNA-binding NtrC family response regulator